MIKKLKQLFARFRAWQRNPFHSKPMAREVHHCLNCGQDFEGNFCPSCGQKANVGRLGWKSVMEKLFDVWDMEKGSLPTTLWHLLWRPGYMICDYLDGKRRHYYSPVMLVFILGVVDAIVESLVETPSFHEPSHSVSTSITAFQNNGANKTKAGRMLFMILPFSCLRGCSSAIRPDIPVTPCRRHSSFWRSSAHFCNSWRF